MLVKAKCVAPAWDSVLARDYYPGQEYEIDTDSSLATLTVVPVAYDSDGNAVRYYRDNDGIVKTKRVAKPDYVFQFDRNATRTDTGEIVVKDYSCKKCGVDFKNLAALGSHTRSFHKDDELIKDPTPVTEVFADRTCATCGKVCKSVYGLRLHQEKSHAIATDYGTAETSVPA